MSTMNKLSLITACYNSELTITDTLRSVNDQTYSNIEHIVIDGGSNDSTMSLVSQYGERVVKTISEKDKGIYDAYNKGLTLASGEIIGFINSDDFYASDTVLAKVMSVFEDPSIDACHANLCYVDSSDTSKIERIWRSWNYRDVDFKRGHIPAHPTVFLRRELYEKYGHFSLDFGMVGDNDLLLRMFYGKKINSIHVDEIWVHMRAGGATGVDGLKGILNQSRALREVQKNNGIHSSLIIYILAKVFSRVTQIFKARFHTFFHVRSGL
jgi:glycosyltransferase involved in cell wall biosynthesis